MRLARPADIDRVAQLRAEAANWLATEVGSDQWAEPWPSENEMRLVIHGSIERGETWMAEDGYGHVIGTVALDNRTAAGLWTEDEMAEPARYIHRLIVDRSRHGEGIGAQILAWAGQQAKRAGAKWLRADVWTDNPGLHRYYLGQGFTHVRTVHRDDYPSGALFQRAVP